MFANQFAKSQNNRSSLAASVDKVRDTSKDSLIVR
jgi:hypothetical protein